jgi:hypothetical protein
VIVKSLAESKSALVEMSKYEPSTRVNPDGGVLRNAARYVVDEVRARLERIAARAKALDAEAGETPTTD